MVNTGFILDADSAYQNFGEKTFRRVAYFNAAAAVVGAVQDETGSDVAWWKFDPAAIPATPMTEGGWANLSKLTGGEYIDTRNTAIVDLYHWRGSPYLYTYSAHSTPHLKAWGWDAVNGVIEQLGSTLLPAVNSVLSNLVEAPDARLYWYYISGGLKVKVANPAFSSLGSAITIAAGGDTIPAATRFTDANGDGGTCCAYYDSGALRLAMRPDDGGAPTLGSEWTLETLAASIPGGQEDHLSIATAVLVGDTESNVFVVPKNASDHIYAYKRAPGGTTTQLLVTTDAKSRPACSVDVANRKLIISFNGGGTGAAGTATMEYVEIDIDDWTVTGVGPILTLIELAGATDFNDCHTWAHPSDETTGVVFACGRNGGTGAYYNALTIPAGGGGGGGSGGPGDLMRRMNLEAA